MWETKMSSLGVNTFQIWLDPGTPGEFHGKVAGAGLSSPAAFSSLSRMIILLDDLMDRENRPLIGKHLFRVQKLSHKSYSFVLHSNPSLEQDRAMKDITWKRVHSPAGMKGAIKVRLNHLGEIVEVGDVC